MEKKATTSEQRARLRDAGFVRVDGLQVSRQSQNRRGKIVLTVEPREGDLGYWDKRSNLIAVYTSGGEIWLAMNTIEPTEDKERAVKIDELRSELCPNGRGVFVPGSNGDKFSWREILRRTVNPDW